MKEANKSNQFTEKIPQHVPAIQTIQKQWAHSYNGAPWYGRSIKKVLELIDPDYAFDSPEKNMQSIGEIIAHMLSCRKYAEQQLQGNTDYKFQEEEFDWKNLSANKKEAWNVLMDRFQASQEKLMQFMNQSDDTRFEIKVSDKDYTFRNMLSGILQHDIYHLGQVEYLHNLLNKKKEPAKGMFKYSFRIFSFENLAQQK